MAEYIDTGDTVEGQKCEIYTRREDCKGLREDPITQEKILRDELNIHGEVGDKLKADAITVYVDVKRQLSVEKQEGLTSTHGGRLISTKKRTVGRIKYPFQNLNKLLGLSANSNNRKQLNK